MAPSRLQLWLLTCGRLEFFGSEPLFRQWWGFNSVIECGLVPLECVEIFPTWRRSVIGRVTGNGLEQFIKDWMKLGANAASAQVSDKADLLRMER